MALFGRLKTSQIEDEVRAVYGSVAERVLSGDLMGATSETLDRNLDETTFFALRAAEAKVEESGKDVDKLDKMLASMMSVVTKRIGILKSRLASAKSQERVHEVLLSLRNLKRDLENVETSKGIIMFANNARNEIERAALKLKEAVKRISPDTQMSAALLRNLFDFMAPYEILDDLAIELGSIKASEDPRI